MSILAWLAKQLTSHDFQQQLVTQILVIAAFVILPAAQYLWLRRRTRREGAMNLSAASTGFRLAAQNRVGRYTFSDLSWRAVVRPGRKANGERMTGLMPETELIRRHDFFLFPGCDEILLAFRLEGSVGAPELVVTTLHGETVKRVPLYDGLCIVCDFTATIERNFNLNFKIAKRVDINLGALLMQCRFDEARGRFEAPSFPMLNQAPIWGLRVVH